MDIQTQKFYSNNHKSILTKYRAAGAGISKYFVKAFLDESSVLDIGCGSGRDLDALISGGFKAEGVDSCSEFVNSISEYYPGLAELVTNDSLLGLRSIKENSFDGVLCSAVLMHLPQEFLFDRLLRNENFFKFKAKNRFNHRHIGHIPRIKYIF